MDAWPHSLTSTPMKLSDLRGCTHSSTPTIFCLTDSFFSVGRSHSVNHSIYSAWHTVSALPLELLLPVCLHTCLWTQSSPHTSDAKLPSSVSGLCSLPSRETAMDWLLSRLLILIFLHLSLYLFSFNSDYKAKRWGKLDIFKNRPAFSALPPPPHTSVAQTTFKPLHFLTYAFVPSAGITMWAATSGWHHSGLQTQDFMHGRQAFYHLSDTPAEAVYFWPGKNCRVLSDSDLRGPHFPTVK